MESLRRCNRPTSAGRRVAAHLGIGLALALALGTAQAQTANTTTKYTYDALDRLTQVTDPSGLNTTYQYDGLSDPTGLTSPDTGVTARTYDAAGNVLTATDAKGILVTYTYDAQNRRLSASYPDSTQNVAYHYDEANSVTGCSSSYPIGRLTRIVETTVTTVYCYDAQGRVIEKQQIVGTTTNTTGYAYTAAGRLSGLVYPSGTMVTYARDSDGRIQSVSVTPPNGAASTAVSSVTYQPFGPVSGYTLGNGQAVARSYDANYRLTDLASPAFSLHVARDAMGDITAIGNAPGANPATETYSYDPLYRLTAITEANGSTQESVTYNPTGDRLSKTGSGLDTGAYSYNPNTHQLVATGTYTRAVDADGNTTAITAASGNLGFGYNVRNRMILAQVAGTTVASYTYDALGERIAKDVSGSTKTHGHSGGKHGHHGHGGKTGTSGSAIETYGYDEARQLLSEQGATNRDYVWMGGIPVANVDTTGTTSTLAYVTADQVGTPRAISAASGATLWQWPYQGNAFEELSPTSSTGYVYNLRSPGQYYDAETGLHYNGARYYEPGTGRFPQSDPMGLFGGQISTYAYGNNDPLSNIDPSGLGCSVSGGFVTCAYPGGGPTFRLPAPAGFPASIEPSDFWYHKYDITRSIGCANPNDVMQGLINNPTPGNPKPATPGGTPNNAAVPVIAPNNPVMSYVTSDLNTGAPIVVNITGANSAFAPGYVARTVTDGVAHTYGEGDAWTQSPLGGGLAPNWAADQYVWGGQMSQIIANSKQQCGCTH